ncbi:hypothetical protein O3M35_004055 [Rhynocoris fuscipes]|uniref:C2H2-type domain-containing protein n=1 Tax=Rhynocoris fuscipes TaxID=488301 RepID=A0AAW1CMZ1_9HEMI
MASATTALLTMTLSTSSESDEYTTKKRRKQSKPSRIQSDPIDYYQSADQAQQLTAAASINDDSDLPFPLNLSSSHSSKSPPHSPKDDSWHGHYLSNTNLLSQQLILPNFKRLFSDSSAHRIFNPEAFCDLCNKEFCNKYFLKTHKANKHGIYMENIPTVDISMPMLNYFPSTPKKTLQQPIINQPKNTTSSMRAFCNICQREFCNKYFVRRHKAKIHGIVEVDEDRQEDISLPGPSSSEIIKKESEEDDSSPHQALSLLVTSWSNEESKDSSKSPERNKRPPQINNASPTVFCEICSKEYCNKYFLRVHKQKCHGYADKLSNQPMPLNLILRESNEESCSMCPATFSDNYLMRLHYEQAHQPDFLMSHREDKNEEPENFFCEICNKDMGTLSVLENHIIKEHSASVEELSNGFNSEFGNRNQIQLATQDSNKSYVSSTNFIDGQLEEKSSEESDRPIQHTPTSSFCEICKKELCNKYFMKTHMQRMHGISIENGAQIGGVVCDICNKELCSKYFLRVHKQNSHGIVEEALLPQVSDVKQSPDPLKPQEADLTHRYFSHFTEVCAICSRRFRSVKWLKAHLLNDHGNEGRDKWRDIDRPEKKGQMPSTSYQEPLISGNILGKKYQCTYCPFVTPILALLLVHERGHLGQDSLESMQSSNGDTHQESVLGLRCARCSFSTSQLESYTDHVSTVHGEDCPPLVNVLKDALVQVSNSGLLPAAFSLPTSYSQYTMQPFLLEDPTASFISSLVYLPVRDRFSQPITASFRLTPT